MDLDENPLATHHFNDFTDVRAGLLEKAELFAQQAHYKLEKKWRLAPQPLLLP